MQMILQQQARLKAVQVTLGRGGALGENTTRQHCSRRKGQAGTKMGEDRQRGLHNR